MTNCFDYLWRGCKYRRALLKNKETTAYDEIFNMFKERVSENTIKYVPQNFNAILNDVITDNPLIFYVEGCTIYTSQTRNVLKVKYSLPQHEIEQILKEVEINLRPIREKLYRGNIWDTVHALHDFILDNIEYNDIEGGHTILGPIINHQGVCDGIAKYAKILCDLLCIKCVQITGNVCKAGIANSFKHSWNAIQIGHDWFYFDFTFDLTLSNEIPVKTSRYDYFALGLENIRRDHFDFDINVSPVGTYDYYARNNLLVRNQGEMEVLIRKSLQKERSVTFKVSMDWKDFDIEAILNDVLQSDKIKFLVNDSLLYTYNPTQRICCLVNN